MLLQKEQLRGNYDWVGSVNPTVFTNSASRRIFDRHNGNQVLFLVNLFLSFSEKQTLSEGLETEEILNKHLPVNVQSEISTLKWLRENFDVIRKSRQQR